jgi:CPA2 family monovalent cation:H+ antiporter-2
LLFAAKVFWGGLPAVLFGYGARVGVEVGATQAQIGEFSFVLVLQGLQAGLISPPDYQLFLTVALLSMAGTPLVSRLGEHAGLRLASRLPSPSRPSLPAATAAPAEGHVVVLGFGHTGETLARVLTRAKVPFRVLDLNPERVHRGREKGFPIEYGDTTSERVLRRLEIGRARAALVLLSDLRATRRTIALCRSLAPSLFLLARTRYLSEIPELAAAGADEVVAEEFETSLEISGRTLRRLGFPLPWVEAETDSIRRARHDAFRRFRAPEAAPEEVHRALGATRVEFVSVASDWHAAGRTLADLNLPGAGGASVLAIVRDGQAHVPPSGDFAFRGTEQVLLLGTQDAIEKSLSILKGIRNS